MSGVSTYLLNPLDDYWIHQANLPMNMVASKDKLWLEQSWWGFFDRESGIKNAFNFWVYPNMRTASVSFTFGKTPHGRVQLAFAHSGWPHQQGNFEKCNALWGMMLHHLRGYAEHGKTAPAYS